MAMNSVDWQQAYNYLVQQEYDQAINLYEQAIEQDPDQKAAYWYLGLTSLLQGDETAAQTIWLMAMAEGEPEQIEQWTEALIAILQQEAQRHEEKDDRQNAWLLRQHLRELAPTYLNNLLQILYLALQLEQFNSEDLANFQAIELLQSKQPNVDAALLLKILQQLPELELEHPLVLEFITACLPYAQDYHPWIEALLLKADTLSSVWRNNGLACHCAELCLGLDTQNPDALKSLCRFYLLEGKFTEAIDLAHQHYATCQSLTQKLEGNALLIKALMESCLDWQAAETTQQNQAVLLRSWLTTVEPPAEQLPSAVFFCSSFFFAPYFDDRPQETRLLQNQVAQRYQLNVDNYLKHYQPDYQPYSSTLSGSANRKILRIGYVSSHLRQHSVGWLSRWLFQYFNRDRFEVYVYFNQQLKLSAFSRQWFSSQATRALCTKGDILGIAKQIQADKIDILVDLDSITTPTTCKLMALKPAPIQVSWLGLDASGLPAVDYFIADPYVLAENAQSYYNEKIWRLPNTYIAVDGFEVGTPTLRREDLDIPADAVVYFSSQYAGKRHPNTVRLQMQILQKVPNSYFFIKGPRHEQGVQARFEKLAGEMGVSGDRLRFLPMTSDEQTHRANLAVADVVLDTYPYTGATTTLESLWMGIPLVTRVGEQFAARNSYTMMMNAGITEGIAWTDEEYVEWGVRLGKDATLRQQIAWRLRLSRQTSPLWNTRQFAQEMERAYEQMWAKYLEQ